MNHDRAQKAGEPRMGDSIEDIRNVSGSVPTVGSTVRQNRGPDGRWRPRSMTLIRGLAEPGSERTELLTDTVTGRPLRGRNNSVLIRDPMEFESVHYVSPTHSGGVPDQRVSNSYGPLRDALVSHVMSCPECATGGACCG
jgi:hypothetical protein